MGMVLDDGMGSSSSVQRHRKPMPSPPPGDNPFRAGVLPETQVLLAGQDLLTGLSSRAGLDAHYRYAVARARRSDAPFAIGLAVLDVDPAAPHDDVFGHDLRVVEVARRLRTGLRETDLIARLGETRFAFVAEKVTPAGLDSIVHRVARALTEPGAEQSAPSGGRVGLALWENDRQTLAALLRAAEETLSAEPETVLRMAANAEAFGAQGGPTAIAPPPSRGRRFARRALGAVSMAAVLMLALSTATPAWRSRWSPLEAVALQGWSELRARLPTAFPAERRP